MRKVLTLLALLGLTPMLPSQEASPMNPYVKLMQQAWQHAQAHGAVVRPVLSPVDSSVLSKQVPISELQAQGFRIVPWTTNDPEKMRAIIRMGANGLISDRPDLLQRVLAEERAAATTNTQRHYLDDFDVAAHRGGRGLRPENTLPSFESGMDNLVTTLETDTGVTTDRVSLIWHDQFLNPESCRRADGTPYTMENRVYIRDISMPEAQKMFICDKLHSAAFPDQKNDLALSPAAVAFAAVEHMPSPYAPTNAEQLFRFTRFYAEYYRAGAGKSHPDAAKRAATGDKIRFNLETKILPDRLPAALAGHQEPNAPADLYKNHTVAPQFFVDALTGAIKRQHMESRSEIQSFDFRTLILVEEQHPELPTYYLTNNAALFASEFTPEPLRQLPAQP